MKYIILLSLILNFDIQAQDTLFFINNTTATVSIKQVQMFNIQYKIFNYEDGPLITKNISEIKSIRYKNGDLEIIDHEALKNLVLSNISDLDKPINQIDFSSMTYNQITSIADQDAINHYKPNGVGTGIFFVTILTTPLIGGLISVQSNATTPNINNLNMPDKDIIHSPIYQNAYKKRVHKIKKEKIVTNYTSSIVFQFLCSIIYIVAKK